MGGDSILGLEQADSGFGLATGQLPGHGQADDPPANNGDVAGGG